MFIYVTLFFQMEPKLAEELAAQNRDGHDEDEENEHEEEEEHEEEDVRERTPSPAYKAGFLVVKITAIAAILVMMAITYMARQSLMCLLGLSAGTQLLQAKL